MPNLGPNPWGTSTDNASVGSVAWNGTGSPGTPTVSISTTGSATPSHYLELTAFGFSLGSGNVPVGLQAAASVTVTGGTGFDNSVKLIIGGSIVGNEKATSTTATSWTWGGASDLWGTTPSSVNVSSASFGFALSLGTSSGFQVTLATGTMEVFYLPEIVAPIETSALFELGHRPKYFGLAVSPDGCTMFKRLPRRLKDRLIAACREIGMSAEQVMGDFYGFRGNRPLFCQSRSI